MGRGRYRAPSQIPMNKPSTLTHDQALPQKPGGDEKVNEVQNQPIQDEWDFEVFNLEN